MWGGGDNKQTSLQSVRLYPASWINLTPPISFQDLYIETFQPHTSLIAIKNATSAEEQQFMKEFSEKNNVAATLLPIKTVGVQVRMPRLVSVSRFGLKDELQIHN